MQELIGNMTAEQFTQFIGTLLGCVFCVLILSAFATAFLCSVIDGWLFRKGALYYGSLRYLNKCFKNLKAATSNSLLNLANVELLSAIHILRYHRVIPKIMYKHFLDKQDQIYYNRRSEIDCNFIP